ncbi:MAG: glycosyltransferase family 39 protein [Bacteroidia bacterium]|nr:glycosyltransferase family 39 protein [Bacteroidia bacterium]
MALTIFSGVIVAYVAGEGVLIKSDAEGYYVHLRSFIIDGDFHYYNEYTEYCKQGFRKYAEHVTPTGYIANKTFIGPAILWLPFFLIAHALTIIFGNFGVELQADGYSNIYQLLAGLSSALYGYVGLILIYRILLNWFQKSIAFISVGFVFIGTNVLYYLISEPCMSHSMSLFAVSLFLSLWIKHRESKGSWIWIGFSIGIMFLIRPQNIFFIVVIFPFVYKSITDRNFINSIWLVKAATVSCLVLIPQLILWKIIYGQLFMYSYTGESFDFTNPVLFKSLFSPNHGLIQWTPIVGVAIIGTVLATRVHQKWAILFLVCFAMQWYVNASWWSWWFGQSFGNRAYINCSLIFAFGLAYLLHSYKQFRIPLLLLLILLALGNVLIFLSYSSGWKTGDQPATYTELISGSIEVIPVFIKKLIALLGLS